MTQQQQQPTALCLQRLSKEYRGLQKSAVPFVEAVPDPTNILDLHFVVSGLPDTPYTAGHYHGMLRFSPEYPLRPPSIYMFTPSGRFETNTRLCLSISDFHVDSWNPLWSVQSILTGFVSFMTEEAVAVGSIRRTASERRRFAAASLSQNVRNAKFRALFPHLVALHSRTSPLQQQQQQQAAPSEFAEVRETGEEGRGGFLMRPISLCVGSFGIIFVSAVLLLLWLSTLRK